MKKNIFIVLVSSLALFLASCGTLLKPNQVGKPHSSQLDLTIVLLDVIGLLFFIIPKKPGNIKNPTPIKKLVLKFETFS